MEGRTTKQKANLSKTTIEQLNKMFPDISVLSINIRAFEKSTYSVTLRRIGSAVLQWSIQPLWG
jgi:hypothetical protein